MKTVRFFLGIIVVSAIIAGAISLGTETSTATDSPFHSTLDLVTDNVMPVKQSDVIEAWQYGQGVDNNDMQDWSKVSGTPTVYNGYIFVRSCGNLVKLDFDGNEIWKRESVSTNNMFYHFVTCGDGKVVDNETGKVYDVNGTYLYQLSIICKYMIYYESDGSGYFIGAGVDSSIHKYSANPNQNVINGVKSPEKSTSGRTYSVTYSYIPPLIIGDVLVYTNHSTASLDVVELNNLSLIDSYSFPKGLINTLSRSQPTYYDGKIFFTTYTRPLLGSPTYVYGSIISVPISSDGHFDHDNIKITKTMSDMMCSSVVFYGGYGYVNAGDKLKVIDPETLQTLAECDSTLSHATPVLCTAYNELEGKYQVYLYLNPYGSTSNDGEDKQDLWLFSHTVSNGVHSLSSSILKVAKNQYCSQTMTLGPNGEMIWYNDSGYLFCVKTNVSPTKKYPVEYDIVRDGSDVSDMVYISVRDANNNIIDDPSYLSIGNYSYKIEWADLGITGKTGNFSVTQANNTVNVIITPEDCNDPSWDDWIELESSNGVTKIKSYSGPGGTVTVPDTSASVLSSTAFRENASIVNVMLPVTIVKTESSDSKGPFYGCTNLRSVTAPGISYLGTYTFTNCSSLTNVALSDSVTEVSKGCFDGCISLTTLYLPNLNKVSDCGFKDCYQLTNLTTSNDGLLWAGVFSFENCHKLKSIKFDDNANDGRGATVRPYSFRNCTSLQTVNCNLIELGAGAFSGCTSLKEVTITGISSIQGNGGTDAVNETPNDGVFQGCVSLETLCMPSVNYIHKEGLTNCISLKNITFSENSWREFYFKNCESLTSIQIPDGTTVIYDSAFLGCLSLKEISIPDTVTNIGDKAFIYSGITEYTVGRDITTFNPRAFYGCANLTEFKTNNVNYYVEDGILYTNDGQGKKILLAYPYGRSGSSYCVSQSVDIIGPLSFGYNNNLESIVIPGEQTKIDDLAFSYSCLRSVTFMGTEIGNRSFGDCVELISVHMPNVTDLGRYAFCGCINLDNVLITSNLSELTMQVFSGCINSTRFVFDKDVEELPSLETGIVSVGTYPFNGMNVKFYLPDTKSLEFWTSEINRVDGHANIEPILYSEIPSFMTETVVAYDGSVKKSEVQALIGSFVTDNLPVLSNGDKTLQWSYDPSGNDPVGAYDTVSEDLQLYAQWIGEEADPSIEFSVSQDGSVLSFGCEISNIPGTLRDPVLQVIFRHSDNIENVYIHLSPVNSIAVAEFSVSHRNLSSIGLYLVEGIPTGIHSWYAENIYQVKSVKVDFVDGSDLFSSSSIFASTCVGQPQQVTKEGYEFAGFYSDSDCTTVFDFEAPIIKDTQIFLKWVKISSVMCVASENGTIVSDKASAKAGQTVTVTLTPAEGYAVSSVTVSGTGHDDFQATRVSDNVYSFDMPAYDVSVRPSFEEVPSNSVSVLGPSTASYQGYTYRPLSKNGQASAWNTVDDYDGCTSTNVCKSDVYILLGEAVSIPVDTTTFTGHTFSLRDSQNTNLSSWIQEYNMAQNSHVVVPAAVGTYDLVFTAVLVDDSDDPSDPYIWTETYSFRLIVSSAVSDKASAKAGQTVTVTLTPAEGYAVSSVTVSGTGHDDFQATRVSDNVYSFDMPAYDVSVRPSFEESV